MGSGQSTNLVIKLSCPSHQTKTFCICDYPKDDFVKSVVEFLVDGQIICVVFNLERVIKLSSFTIINRDY